MRALELLAPAKNLECGIAAIDHGADAVYIGASRFGARAAVGNSLEDIHKLCEYAHPFGAKVYVTVNTILYDEAPVYNVGHLAGLFSAFNDDALATATLYKGLIPAQFGGASSAVFDIATRTGNRQQWHGSATIGLLAAKVSAEGPVVKDKLGVLNHTWRLKYKDN